MNIPLLAAKNVTRNKLRTGLTIAGVSVTILGFVLMRTVVGAWTVGVEAAAKDRIGTRHKVSFTMQLPKRYFEDVRNVPGIKASTFINWFGAKDPKHENEFFANLAIDARTALDVYDELLLPAEQKEAWLGNKRGAIVGDVLASKLGWKLGDKIILQGTIYPGDWEFEVSGIYTATRKSIDRSTLFFHWDYMNESLPPARQDQIGWIVSRVDGLDKAASVSAAIDQMFDSRDIQTMSQSERDMNNSFLGFFSAILKALDIVSVVILAIMALILGNTIAMGVRERTTEYGVLRALGFSPRHIGIFVLGEAITLGLLGGLAGLALSYPVVEQGMGRFIEENMGSMFPYFRIPAGTAVSALVLAVVLALAASVLPALNASRLKTIDALRRVG